MFKVLKHNLTSLIVAGMLVLAGFVGGTMVFENGAAPTADVVLQAQVAGVLTQNEQLLTNVYQQASASVVSITNVVNGTAVSSGSGFVISGDGYIVTNFHVVDGATELIVDFIDGTVTRANVIGLDPDADLAVLQVNVTADRLYPLEFADSDTLQVGQTVVAIGSPFGQDWTMTTGIVSALDRTIDSPGGSYSIGAAIQTDAPINPGNSGGPLLNLSGQVVGVNSQIISRSNSSAGVGFAVPSNLTRRVATDLINTGDVQYSLIGISAGVDLSLNVIEALNLPNNQQGVLVTAASDNGPAERAGIRDAVISQQQQLVSADIIVAIDNQPVTSFSSLISYLAENTRPGDNVTLTVLRDGQQFQVPLTLAARP